MGFKEWLAASDERAEKAKARMAEIRQKQAGTGSFAGVYLNDGMIGWNDHGSPRREPVTGARAEVAVGADAQRRITATRIVLPASDAVWYVVSPLVYCSILTALPGSVSKSTHAGWVLTHRYLCHRVMGRLDKYH